MIEFSGNLGQILSRLPRTLQAGLTETVERQGDRIFRRVKNRTPVDSGGARRRWKRKKSRSVRTGVIELDMTNDADHINVLEFGGYPVTPANRTRRTGGFRRGAAILGGAPPGPRTRRAPGGQPQMTSNVSKQAPRGMLRSALQDSEAEFLTRIDARIQRILDGQA